MIQIPEELLKMTSRELDKVLSNNIYKTKYLSSGEFIYRIENKLGHQVICRNLKTNAIVSFHIENLEPVTKELIEKEKLEKIRKYLNYCSNEEFKSYLINQVKEIFPEERYDVTIKNDVVTLIIHYPEITITNSHELSHNIKDLYVKFDFTVEYGSRKLKRTGIGRTTYYDYEYDTNYIFSHVSTSNLLGWNSSICYGETALREINSKLHSGIFSSLFHFILSYESYLSWESLEGTPYHYISNLQNKGNYKKFTDNLYNSYHLTKVLRNITNFNYTYDLKNGEYVINLEQNTVDIIENLLTDKFPQDCYPLINGESYKTSNSRSRIDESGQDTNIEFKGEIKKLNIINTKDESIIPEVRIHRSILNGVINDIKKQFYSFIFNKKLEEYA